MKAKTKPIMIKHIAKRSSSEFDKELSVSLSELQYDNDYLILDLDYKIVVVRDPCGAPSPVYTCLIKYQETK